MERCKPNPDPRLILKAKLMADSIRQRCPRKQPFTYMGAKGKGPWKSSEGDLFCLTAAEGTIFDLWYSQEEEPADAIRVKGIYRLYVIDLDPSSVTSGGWLEDTSLVEKYTLSEEAYDKLDGKKEKKMHSMNRVPLGNLKKKLPIKTLHLMDLRLTDQKKSILALMDADMNKNVGLFYFAPNFFMPTKAMRKAMLSVMICGRSCSGK
ncbi:hypothetical protein RJ639_000018 [Escallonia herrerae]|uniref:Uncharacterized protein n=1 Tax=Escallonia herrerae TaxID=1293975 RepID=A0AA88XEF2_9ASTE|nr:hypothetical protein RJ639_000018 [Escallonia herrerae]